VNLVQRAGKDADCDPIDYRGDAPDVEGKTKKEHCPELCVHAIEQQPLQARTILFDGWSASAENLELIHRRQRIFFTTLKNNRWVSLSKESGDIHLEEVAWTAERLRYGVLVKVKGVPFYVRLFPRVAPNGDSAWGIPNDREETVPAQGARETSDGRWQVEELHRGSKQLTGSEECQGRAARAQRNHLACGSHAWRALKVQAKALGQTLYAVRGSLFSRYLRTELRSPHVMAC
jgi:hypothetical protein